MVRTPERRRRLVVNKEVQSRIVMSIALPPAIMLMVTALAVGFLCVRLQREALQVDAELPSLVPVMVTIGLFCIVAVTFIAYAALRFSNRVAGPTYRLLKTLEAVRAGDANVRAKLRKGDYLDDLAEGLNEFLEELAQSRGSSSENSETAREPDSPAESPAENAAASVSTGEDR